MELPAIPLLGIYPEKMKTLIQKDSCTPVFTEALFTIARAWRQPKCPFTEEWIKQMWYIDNGISLSHRQKQNWVFCRDLDGPRNCDTE